ncbi:MAG: ATP-binding protein [Candidatus Uhrbacteria bacterium]
MALPQWLDEIRGHIQSGASHCFLLTLNVGDLFASDNGLRYTTLQNRLAEVFADRRLVICYDRSGGITFIGATPAKQQLMEREFRMLIGMSIVPPTPPQLPDAASPDDALSGTTQAKASSPSAATANPAAPKPEPELEDETDIGEQFSLPRDPSQALPLIEYVLTMPAKRAAKCLGDKPEAFARGWCVVIMEYAEAIAPAGDFSVKTPDVQTSIITLARWSRDEAIAASGNIVLFTTMNEDDVTSYLRNATTSTAVIRLPFPKLEDRRAFLTTRLAALAEKRPKTTKGTNHAQIAAASAGLTLRQLDAAIREAALDHRPVELDAIWARKRRLIEEMSGGLLRIVRPTWTMEHLGGLPQVKRYLAEVANAIRNGYVTQVPQGILFLGPPGCGKSVTAEALASAIGFPMVTLQNIQDKWLGQSGRNLSLVFHLLEELVPVLVFEDEFDQRNLERGVIFHGDSGVGADLMARKLEFLADTRHRGKILWIAASNRPDLMDPAMLRPGRFDTKVPFLPPTAEERVAVFGALMRKIERQARDADQPLVWSVPEGAVAEITKRLEGCTGAEMEVVLNRATLQAARAERTDVRAEDIGAASDDFLPSRNEAFYRYTTLLALGECDSIELLPEHYRAEARDLRNAERLEELRRLHRVFGGLYPKEEDMAKA